MLRSARVTHTLAGLLVAAAVVHLGAHLAAAARLTEVSQWFLMPLLAAWVVAATTGRSRDRIVRLTLAALVASWLGDTVPDLVPSGASFLAMVGFFLCAQACYIAAFWPFRSRSVLGSLRAASTGRRRARATATVAYVVVFIALVAACAPGTGSLLVPTIVYGLCLVSMAALATGVNGRVALGGAIFLVSDSLIALQAFTSWYALHQHGFWVMLTYVVGQALIASGVVAQVRIGARTGVDRGAASRRPAVAREGDPITGT